ncbi:MAG: diacylglycerol kinase family protein [Acutalibacteraceae bacterium]
MEYYKKLFRSFVYAFSGLFSAVKNERNMRIHLTCLAYMFGILCSTDWFVLSRAEWAILVLASGGVIAGELVNTAVENAVNLASTEHTAYGKLAKDTAAGAVLVSAIAAVAVGVIILFQPQAFQAMAHYFREHILMFVLFVLSIIPATAFIFLGIPFVRKEKK